KELARHRPDVVFEILTIVDRRGTETLLSVLDEPWIEPLLRPLGFIELADRRPQVAATLLRWVLGRNNGRIKLSIAPAPDVVRELVETLVDPRFIADVVNVRPAIGDEVIQLLEAQGSKLIDPEAARRWERAWHQME